MISAHHLRKISLTVANTFGWNFQQDRLIDLERGLLDTALELGIKETPAEIEKWIENISWTTKELEILTTHLTVGETYFFREKAWLDIFQDHIIPEIIRNRTGKDQYIRIWSAGCCSGEEPYSLAMLMLETIPDIKNWNITILGTDINRTFLAKAKTGIYTPWSFRETSASKRDRFFSPAGFTWQIDQKIQNLVTFAPLNLVDDRYPSESTNTHNMDVIFCRNVLMYFSHEHIGGVVRRFYQSLTENGWLIAGAVELNNITFSEFNPVRFGSCTVYHKSAKPLQQVKIPDQPIKVNPHSPIPVIAKTDPQPGTLSINSDLRATYRKTEENKTAESNAMNFFLNSQYDQCASACKSILTKTPDNIEILTILVRSQANLGLLKEAGFWAQKLSAQPNVNADHYYLTANILFEENEIKSAESMLKRALYLDPHHLMSHFLLGTISNQLENKYVASKHFKNVKELLDEFENEEIVPGSDGMTAGRFREILANLIFLRNGK